MSQHDGIIADASGAAFLADLNLFLPAILSCSSGLTAPAVMYAYQWWADTTTGILKQRNGANTAWVSILTMSTGALVGQGLGTPSSGVLTNCTGTAAGLNIGGNAATATTATTAGNLTGTPAFFAPITSSLGADVTTSAGSYVTGPSIAQGTSGKWFVSGTVTINCIKSPSGGSVPFNVILWDGITVLASALQIITDLESEIVSLSGYISAPAGNLRIAVEGNTGSKIKFNASGNSKDSTITAIRVG